MKKVLLLLALFICGASVNAQSYFNADFEDGLGDMEATSGWNNGDALESQYFPIPAHTNYVAVNDDADSADYIDESLTTPEIDLSAASGTVLLEFDYFFVNGDYEGDEQASVAISYDGSSWESTDLAAVASADEWTNGFQVEIDGDQSSVWVRFGYTDDGGWEYGLAIDNVNVYSPLPNDAAVISLDIPALMGLGDVAVSGAMKNFGSETITSFGLAYSLDGGAPVVATIDGVSVGTGDTYNFTHPEALNFTTQGSHDLEVSIVSVNGGDDDDTSNNTASATFGLVEAIPVAGVVIEEATGTWCGWCPRGSVGMDYMADAYPDAVLVAVHNGDPMVVSEWDGAMAVGGYPSGLVDRLEEVDPGAGTLDAAYNARLSSKIPAAHLDVQAFHNEAWDEITIELTADFLFDSSDDFRFNAFIIEDGVTGTGSGWAQANYYSGGGSGAMGGYEDLADPVPAEDMVYDHVGRAILGGANGMSGSLPNEIIGGTEYTYTFTYSIPADIDPTMVSVAGLIQHGGSGEFENSVMIHHDDIMPEGTDVGIEDNAAVSSINLFPNPTEGISNLVMNLTKESKVNVTVMNALGQTVMTNNAQRMAGKHIVTVDANNFSAGIYMVNVEIDGQSTTERLIVK